MERNELKPQVPNQFPGEAVWKHCGFRVWLGFRFKGFVDLMVCGFNGDGFWL